MPVAGTYKLSISHIGFQTLTQNIVVSKDETQSINFELKPIPYSLKEADITANRLNINIQEMASRTTVIDQQEIESYPASSTDDYYGLLPM